MITETLQKSIALILFSILFSFSSNCQTYVDLDASSGGNGSSWATAYNNLQTALLASSSGDILWVAEGTYTIVGNEDTSFEIPSGVAVYGGFIGTESNLNDRNASTNLTILDGQNSANSIVYFENSSNTTILDGFIIENGFADGIDQRGQSGSGIYMDIVSPGSICDPQIIDCIIRNNDSNSGGGGVYIDGSWIGTAAPYFENCTFENNYSFGDGGAIYQNGIWHGAVNATYQNCTFINNHSVGSGAGLFNHGGNGNVNSTFKKCNFESNVAEGNGGAMYSLGTSGGSANHLIINCRFYKNTGFAAGGIYNNGGNTDGNGFPGDASPEIINCTFFENEATGNGGTGGAIYNNGSNGGQSNTQIKNCIIWGNIAPYGTHVIKNVSCSPTISYSLTDAVDCNELNNGSGSNITCGYGLIYAVGSDPGFADPNNGDLRISENSDAKDVGHNLSNNEVEDLDGNDRFVGTIDMGAYENTLTLLPVDLLSFEASALEKEVLLEWTTLSEEENAGFILERSQDGRTFESISEIPGAGNSSEIVSYKQVDKNPFNGDNYYRLKIVSFEGGIEYSPVRFIRFETSSISIYPNPVIHQINIEFGDTKTDFINYEIFSIYGQLITKASLEGNRNTSINIQGLDLAPGHYTIRINSKNKSINKRFQKIK